MYAVRKSLQYSTDRQTTQIDGFKHIHHSFFFCRSSMDVYSSSVLSNITSANKHRQEKKKKEKKTHNMILFYSYKNLQ